MKLKFKKPENASVVLLRDCATNDIVRLADGSYGLIIWASDMTMRSKCTVSNMTIVALSDGTDRDKEIGILGDVVRDAIAGKGDNRIVAIVDKMEVEVK